MRQQSYNVLRDHYKMHLFSKSVQIFLKFMTRTEVDLSKKKKKSKVHCILHLFLQYILQPQRLKFISLRNQHGELNCLELNNTGHVGAAELFCRLEGWTVQCTLPPNALSIDLSRNYSSPQKPTQSVQRSAPRHPPLQRCIFTLRNLEKVQLWMHPPTSINDRAGPPDPPCWLIKCFLGLVVSLKALWGWLKLALRFVSIVSSSRKLISREILILLLNKVPE